MKWLPRLVCQHNHIELRRAHRDVCEEHHDKVAWVDIHDCFNFFVCGDCKAVLKPGCRVFPSDLYPPKETP